MPNADHDPADNPSALTVGPIVAAPIEQAPAPPTDPVASLPLWQITYLAALQAGTTPRDAELAARVSTGTVVDHLTKSPRFADAHARVVAGLAVLGRDHARALAAAGAPHLVGHFTRQATDPTVLPQVQQGAGRLVLDAAGVTGPTSQAQPGGVTALQINLVVVTADEVRARRAAQPPPTE